MKKFLLSLIFLFLTICASDCFSQATKGTLVIIGGGEKTNEIMERIVNLAGGFDSKIIIIPNASGYPKEAAISTVEQFNNIGCTNVDYILFTREDADKDSLVEILNGADVIFFSGGDQSYLTRDMLNTKLLDKVFEIYNTGGVIAGTSAGAAVMSKIMITGNELINTESSENFISIQKNNIEVTEGFGFINNAFIDQHFVKRKRLNRTISVVLENPNMLGIGIDESTCIVVNPDETFEVLGENQVIVFDASNSTNIKTDKNGNLGAENVTMYLLINGDQFDMISKTIIN